MRHEMIMRLWSDRPRGYKSWLGLGFMKNIWSFLVMRTDSRRIGRLHIKVFQSVTDGEWFACLSLTVCFSRPLTNSYCEHWSHQELQFQQKEIKRWGSWTKCRLYEMSLEDRWMQHIHLAMDFEVSLTQGMSFFKTGKSYTRYVIFNICADTATKAMVLSGSKLFFQVST